jgi:RNA polymerase subunit RPABC4/transcription elongation factor Spt4
MPDGSHSHGGTDPTMGDLINQITSMLGGIWDSQVVQLGIRAVAIYFVILWLAAAYWAFRDMQLRTSNPILPYLAASMIIVFTPVFFILAIIAYRIVRPQEKIGEVYERTLAEEALLAEVESVKSCPTCARRVHEEWIICPTCRTRLNRVCPNCSRLVGLDWALCAWCGRDFDRASQAYEAAPQVRPAVADPSFARSQAPALAPAYQAPAPRADRAYTQGPPVEATPAQAYDQGPAVALSRAPQPPTATRSDAPSGSRSTRSTRPVTPKAQPTAPISSNDPLPER